MRRQCIQVRSNGVILFDAMDTRMHERHNLHQQHLKPYSGVMTGHARKRLTCALDILIQRNPPKRVENTITKQMFDFRLNFITLTVPNHKYISASKGYDILLSKWIRYMRDKYDVREYVWKAELQQNGQPHWHICSNEFIPWPVIRWKWNQLMRNERLLDSYAKAHGHFNAPSTEIKAVESIVDMQKYLSKELCKSTFLKVQNGDPVLNCYWDKKNSWYQGDMYEEINPDCVTAVRWDNNLECIDYPAPGMKLVEAAIDGKLWDCSEPLKRGRFSEEMDWQTSNIISEARRKGKIDIEHTDFCQIIPTMYPLQLLSPAMQNSYKKYIHS